MTKYAVVYADPPWRFATYSSKGKGRAAEAHYDCMAIDEIKAVPVHEYAATDCILFLWTTHPLLPRALEVMAAWGFTYKTIGFTWVKCSVDRSDYQIPLDITGFPIGTGYWSRANPELCLLGTRGHPKRLARNVRELVVSPRREHSRKPDEIYGRIEALCAGPYLELFARQNWPGWDTVGAVEGIQPRRWKSNAYPSQETDEAALAGVGGEALLMETPCGVG